MDQVIGKSMKECLDCGEQLLIIDLDVEKMWFECERCGQKYESKRPGRDPAFPDRVELQRTGSQGENQQ